MWGRVLTVLDSPVVREETKWSSTPKCRPLSACRLKMRLSPKRSTEASCFLQAVPADSPSKGFKPHQSH